MKVILSVWLLMALVTGAWAAPLEVRSYRVDLLTLGAAHRDVVEDYEVNFEGGDWLGDLVTEALFESRFLKGERELRDSSVRVGEIIGMKGFKGQAVYDGAEGVLVMRAGERDHRALQEKLENRILTMIRTEISVYEMMDVVAGIISPVWKGAPEGAAFLTSLSFLHFPGQTAESRGPDGNFSVELETQIDSNDGITENRMALKANMPEVGFEWKTGFVWVLGVPMVQEVGSLDGEKSVCVVMKQDRVLIDGSLFDEWVMKEEGGAFLLEERLVSLEPKVPVDDAGNEEGEVRRFTVPPTFETFLSAGISDEEDPFRAAGDEGRRDEGPPIYQGNHPELVKFDESLIDCQELLSNTGLTFRDGDFAVLVKSSGTLIAKLSEINFELLEGIVSTRGPYIPRMVRVDFWEIEGDAESGEDYWKKKDAKVSRKVGQILLPGQSGTVRLGNNLAVEVEAMVDSNDELIETRATLSELGGDLKRAAFKTGMTSRSGEAMLIQESRVGDKRKAWVVRSDVVRVEVEALEGR